MTYSILQGCVLDRLRDLPDESVHCVVTSPPYWGLRDYGMDGQIGLEKTPTEFVAKIVEVFREVRRVLRADGTCWVNIGDSYNAYNGGAGPSSSISRGAQTEERPRLESGFGLRYKGLKPKDLIGIPWRIAFALQDDGWWLRQDIIWSKPNPMPESVTDRCTKAHEYIFLLTKSARYFYNADAIKEPCIAGDNGSSYTSAYDQATKPGLGTGLRKTKVPGGWDTGDGAHGTIHRTGRTEAEYVEAQVSDKRNKRSVWTVSTEAFPEAHFATFPTKLIEPCILAGSPEHGTVLDPFNGSGTTGVVALRYHRNYIGIELNHEYVAMAENRIQQDNPMFNRKLA